MSTKPYPSYKDSGVEWLGRIPGHWQAKRLRFATKVNPSKSELRGRAGDTLLTFLPMDRIGEDGSIDLQETRRLDQVSQGFTYFRDGDVLVAKITPCFENGKGGVCRGLQNGFGFGTTELHVLRPLDDVEAQFLFYVTKSTAFRTFGTTTMYGAAGQQRVSEDFIHNFSVALPINMEQRAIAKFLDRETGRIDVLVKKKERLIELLQEKRRALISHAVTKGINPNAPMKDSGTGWFGQVPAHWQAGRLKFRLKKIEQGWSPQCESRPAEQGEWGVLKVGCMNGNQYEESENKALPAAVEPACEFEIRLGDVLMSRANTVELIGSVGIVHKTQGRILLCDKLFRLVFDKAQVLPEYATYLLRSPVARRQIEQAASGASPSMKNISNGAVANMVLPFPPVDEQKRTLRWVSSEAAKLDALVAKVRTAIEHLQEYRTALISAAVTGQIDVGPGA